MPLEEAAANSPAHIGHYRILEEIGRGGMGVVYKAEQREPIRRLVALKVVQAGIGTKEVLSRFQLERRALAAMNHRCIAKVLDADATDKGTFAMGAQKADPSGRNYDEQAEDNMGPVRDVTLAPFFLGKYELTQGQWMRLWSGDEKLRHPSAYQAGRSPMGKEMTLANPVEQVDWPMCESLLRQHGLLLSTEAQWEYACCAGPATPWPWPIEQLQLHANVADATARQAGARWACESWSDGYVLHAQVGTFLPNAFGLHDMNGNVWEWCLDLYGSYSGDVRPGDGLRLGGSTATFRCDRGGSFSAPASTSRWAKRNGAADTLRHDGLGCRAARALRP